MHTLCRDFLPVHPTERLENIFHWDWTCWLSPLSEMMRFFLFNLNTPQTHFIVARWIPDVREARQLSLRLNLISISSFHSTRVWRPNLRPLRNTSEAFWNIKTSEWGCGIIYTDLASSTLLTFLIPEVYSHSHLHPPWSTSLGLRSATNALHICKFKTYFSFPSY